MLSLELVDPPLPADVQATVRVLDYHVQDLHAKWVIYCQLFGKSHERYEVLNKAAGGVFGRIDQAMLEDSQLALCRLGDPAMARVKGGSVPNLTLRRLQEELGAAGQMTLKDELEPLLVDFDSACEQMRDRRNKRLAHFDRAMMVAADAGDITLTNASRREVKTALVALGAVMNHVLVHFGKSPTAYELFVPPPGDGDALAVVLQQGLRYGQLVAEGAIPRDDIKEWH